MADPTCNQSESDPGTDPKATTRLHLLWDVFAFQFKLAADGLRDLVLVPLSLVSAIMGLVVGGDDPYQYFRQLLRLGRRSEIWINLFGHRKHEGTSDDLIAPLKNRVLSEAQNNPWISKAGDGLNKTLDSVGEQLKPGDSRKDKSSD